MHSLVPELCINSVDVCIQFALFITLSLKSSAFEPRNSFDLQLQGQERPEKVGFGLQAGRRWHLACLPPDPEARQHGAGGSGWREDLRRIFEGGDGGEGGMSAKEK